MIPSWQRAGALALASTTLMAAEPLELKPGYWEITTTTTTTGAPPYIPGMEGLAAEQIARSWTKLAGKPNHHTSRRCLTEEEIREATVLDKDIKVPGQSCQRGRSTQSATEWTLQMDCEGMGTKTHVQSRLNTRGPEALEATIHATATSPNGETLMRIVMAGQRLAAACPATPSPAPAPASPPGAER